MGKTYKFYIIDEMNYGEDLGIRTHVQMGGWSDDEQEANAKVTAWIRNNADDSTYGTLSVVTREEAIKRCAESCGYCREVLEGNDPDTDYS